ncbi:SAM-dependent methyltransferase [Actinophytocola oryzae]|uniref:27-O-demethylrifamycin SV methyltransferase n=1 Tax=Actinophytocola oryzae TaxID=502181 RepID=A0A4R7UX05_9PSEU|nr:methyltransferase domain-containing protein [Actinophytocola oryzae]TDV41050.1 27-O-demethylrifamycin SV methyltransferase [Actinophytocola oryzae]
MSNDEGIPDADETAQYYDVVNEVFTGLWDENFHHGYWDSEEDQSSNREACEKLTDQVIERSGDTSGARLLDIGHGFGLSAFRLAGKSDSVTIVGVSNSQPQVDDANRRCAERGLSDRVTFQYGDALELPFAADSFDIVWLFETLPHLDRLAALREANRVLRPGGRVVIADMYLNAEPTEQDLADVREHEATTAASPMLQDHEYREVVAGSGLVLEELKDISAETYRTGVRMLEAVNDNYDRIVETYGEGIVPMLEVVRAPAGRNPVIGYLLAVARKAD